MAGRGDGSDVELHADVLLLEGLEKDERVPVIPSAGSCFGHSGVIFEGIDLFDRGYALVLVDTRDFGGSTGSVGMYGKSYDAVTGLIGNNLDQDALKAVVAQEPRAD